MSERALSERATSQPCYFGPPKKRNFDFWRKNPPKKWSSCFSFDSALKTIDAQMSFRSVFLKTPLWPIWQLLTFFSAFYKILTKTTFVCLIFLKLKQKKKNLIKNLTKNISSYFSKKIKSLHPTGESCFGGFFTDSPRYSRGQNYRAGRVKIFQEPP